MARMIELGSKWMMLVQGLDSLLGNYWLPPPKVHVISAICALEIYRFIFSHRNTSCKSSSYRFVLLMLAFLVLSKQRFFFRVLVGMHHLTNRL